MNNFYEDLKKWLEETPQEEIERVFNKSKNFDNIGPSVEEYLEFVKENVVEHINIDIEHGNN